MGLFKRNRKLKVPPGYHEELRESVARFAVPSDPEVPPPAAVSPPPAAAITEPGTTDQAEATVTATVRDTGRPATVIEPEHEIAAPPTNGDPPELIAPAPPTVETTSPEKQRGSADQPATAEPEPWQYTTKKARINQRQTGAGRTPPGVCNWGKSPVARPQLSGW